MVVQTSITMLKISVKHEKIKKSIYPINVSAKFYKLEKKQSNSETYRINNDAQFFKRFKGKKRSVSFNSITDMN